MEFITKIEQYEDFDFDSFVQSVKIEEVDAILKKEKLSELDFLKLLSPIATKRLEVMAKKAKDLTRQHFGYTIGLYLPIYISNYCTNNCSYCGFSKKNKIKRKQLTLEEIESEATKIASSGVEHILLLTGEAEGVTTIEYVISAVEILKKYFASIHIEIFPTSTSNYEKLAFAGVDGLTIYQETYDKELYSKVHISGKKRDYMYRLLTPQRGAKAGFRAINIGALYGLGDVLKEAFISGLHAKYLQNLYLETEISLSLPRINSSEGNFEPKEILDDVTFVQFMTAFRLFIPKIGINVSTRESANFRDNILELGVTRMSAGSKTEVGGYDNENKSTAQFDITDKRDTDEVIEMLNQRGFQPVLKDWEPMA